MSYSKFLPFILLGVWSLSNAASAADTSDFKQKITERYSKYKTIDVDLLEYAINNVPEQTTTWGCGLHQASHAFYCAYRNSQESPVIPNYEVKGPFPLSVDVNLPQLSKSLGVLAFLLNYLGPFADKGNFRVGPTPHQYGKYLDENLPKDFLYEAKVYSEHNLDFKTFFDHMKTSVANNMPAAIYYLVNPELKMIHFYSVVGYLDNGENSELLLLDTKGKGIERLKSEPASEVLKNLNVGSITGFVKGLEPLRSTLENAEGVSLVSQADLDRWKSYSFVIFDKKNSSTQQ